MPTVFAIQRSPSGLAGWRKDNMPPGTYAMMRKLDGSFGPEIIMACPRCYADLVLSATQAYGKSIVAHNTRQLYDPRKGQGWKTQMCNVQFYVRQSKGVVEIV